MKSFHGLFCEALFRLFFANYTLDGGVIPLDGKYLTTEHIDRRAKSHS